MSLPFVSQVTTRKASFCLFVWTTPNGEISIEINEQSPVFQPFVSTQVCVSASMCMCANPRHLDENERRQDDEPTP